MTASGPSPRLDYGSPAPDLDRHPTTRSNKERATGAQDRDRQTAGEASVARRLGEIDRETREHAAMAGQQYAGGTDADPVVYRKGRQPPAGPADGRTNR